jgi:hypothetical protein
MTLPTLADRIRAIAANPTPANLDGLAWIAVHVARIETALDEIAGDAMEQDAIDRAAAEYAAHVRQMDGRPRLVLVTGAAP